MAIASTPPAGGGPPLHLCLNSSVEVFIDILAKMDVAQESFKYFGLLSIILFTSITVFITKVWHEDNALSLSKHIASHKSSYLLFAITSVVGQVLFILYILKWFIPAYQLGVGIGIMLSIGTMCQVLSAWIPDTKGFTSKLHHYLAYTMAIIMYAFTLWIVLSPTIRTFSRLFCLFSFIVMSCFGWLFFFSKQSRQKMFIYQNVFFALFYASIIESGYIQ